VGDSSYNFDQDKTIYTGHGGKQRSKKECEQNTNRPNPGGHERKILTKLMNAEKNNQAAAAASSSSK
jgi:nuclear protein 1